MAKIRRQNFFNTFGAIVKFTLFWLFIISQVPIIFLLPKGKLAADYMSVFMRILMFFTGVRVRVNGKLSSKRPLLVVSNHISVFELATFSIAFGGSYFGKKEVEKFPLIGWVSKKFGVIFVDRRTMHAMDALKNVRDQMRKVNYPMFLFPEGTTTNGAYVKAFKSTLFDFMETSDATIQPMVLVYRYRDGTKIDDETLAEHFAYFDNIKQDMGPMCSRERSAFSQVFHIMMLGGFTVEITTLLPPILTGMNRKEIAVILQKIISDKYMELKDKVK
ncbi:MAG: 1-acyl-sn-glycerol-3-phosphate acyltransferase [Alphaproteobacteria bacterium]|nr:1-acyl-sn-glycerol-3-phosphate acyltransferase [Alphaproteobacteria bacterium]MBN2675462.1 1-acyl-sn-glycerol-3-phosphate acyltransferase [Alphaproteobacteria bacterium]